GPVVFDPVRCYVLPRAQRKFLADCLWKARAEEFRTVPAPRAPIRLAAAVGRRTPTCRASLSCASLSRKRFHRRGLSLLSRGPGGEQPQCLLRGRAGLRGVDSQSEAGLRDHLQALIREGEFADYRVMETLGPGAVLPHVMRAPP